MKQLLIALLLTSTAYGQTNCTTVKKITTGITIKNVGTYPAKYRIEVLGQADIVTPLLAVNAILEIPVIWCNDSLYVTAIPTGSCSCKLDRIGIYYKCSILASVMDVKASKNGNDIDVWITPLTNVDHYNFKAKIGNKDTTVFIPLLGRELGKPFLYTFKTK